MSDADRNDPVGGIAVTQTSGPGVWSFSLDGTVFVDFGIVASDNALHLPYSADIRFTPSGSGGGLATFTYLAWDQTVGTAGNKSAATWDDVQCVAGGLPDPDTLLCSDGTPPVVTTYVTSTAYSQDVDQKPIADALQVLLTNLPDAPVLIPSNPLMGTTNEHTPVEAVIDRFVSGVFDPDGSNVAAGNRVDFRDGAGDLGVFAGRQRLSAAAVRLRIRRCRWMPTTICAIRPTT